MNSLLLTEWEPSATSRAFAAGLEAMGLDVPGETQKFRDYQHKTEIHDPDKAYVAWLKRAISFHSKRKEPTAGEVRKLSETEHAIAKIREFSQSKPAEFERLRKYMEQHRWWSISTREYQIKQLVEAIRDREMIFEFLDEKGREF